MQIEYFMSVSRRWPFSSTTIDAARNAKCDATAVSFCCGGCYLVFILVPVLAVFLVDRFRFAFYICFPADKNRIVIFRFMLYSYFQPQSANGIQHAHWDVAHHWTQNQIQRKKTKKSHVRFNAICQQIHLQRTAALSNSKIEKYLVTDLV